LKAEKYCIFWAKSQCSLSWSHFKLIVENHLCQAKGFIFCCWRLIQIDLTHANVALCKSGTQSWRGCKFWICSLIGYSHFWLRNLNSRDEIKSNLITPLLCDPPLSVLYINWSIFILSSYPVKPVLESKCWSWPVTVVNKIPLLVKLILRNLHA
jgi:hypothetical protein